MTALPAADLDALLAGAYPVDVEHRRLVPEPAAKALLRELGARVPRSVTATDPASLPELAAHLVPPLVLKAYGPGIVHKSDLGAVRVGVEPGGLAQAASEMQAALAGVGASPAGFLVEEQAPDGIELLVGVLRRPPFGHVAVVGLGGTLTELLEDPGLAL